MQAQLFSREFYVQFMCNQRNKKQNLLDSKKFVVTANTVLSHGYLKAWKDLISNSFF